MPFTNATLQRIADGMEALTSLHGPAVAGLFLQWKDAESLPEPMPSTRLDTEAEPLRRICIAALNAVIYFAEACQHAEAGRPLAAWPLIATAEHWSGCAIGLYRAARIDSPEAMAAAFAAVAERLSAQARRAAEALHKDDRAAREYVRAYYAEHRAEYTSKDAAAEDFADRRLVAAKESTIRRWLRGA